MATRPPGLSAPKTDAVRVRIFFLRLKPRDEPLGTVVFLRLEIILILTFRKM